MNELQQFFDLMTKTVHPIRIYSLLKDKFSLSTLNLIKLFEDSANKDEMKILIIQNINFNNTTEIQIKDLFEFFYTEDLSILKLFYQYNKEFYLDARFINYFKEAIKYRRSSSFYEKYIENITEPCDKIILKLINTYIYEYEKIIRSILINNNILSDSVLKELFKMFLKDNYSISNIIYTVEEYINFINKVKNKPYFKEFLELDDAELKDHIIRYIGHFKKENLNEIKKLFLELFPDRKSLIEKYIGIFTTNVKLVGKINLD